MSRRQLLVLAPAAAVAWAAAPVGGAGAEEQALNLDSDSGCRECSGMGVVPCECCGCLCVGGCAGVLWGAAHARGTGWGRANVRPIRAH